MGTRESIRNIKLGGVHRNTNILKWLWIQTWMKIVFCDVCRGKQDSHKTRFQTLCHVSEWFDNFSALFITSIILFTSAFISWISESVIFHLKAQTNCIQITSIIRLKKTGFEARMGLWFSQDLSVHHSLMFSYLYIYNAVPINIGVMSRKQSVFGIEHHF